MEPLSKTLEEMYWCTGVWGGGFTNHSHCIYILHSYINLVSFIYGLSDLAMSTELFLNQCMSYLMNTIPEEELSSTGQTPIDPSALAIFLAGCKSAIASNVDKQAAAKCSDQYFTVWLWNNSLRCFTL